MVVAVFGEGIDAGFDFCYDPTSTLAFFFGGVSAKSSIFMRKQVMAKRAALVIA